MDERAPCPLCRHHNPQENLFCGRCGASLTGSEQLVPRRERHLSVANRTLPARFKPAGRAVALGLAALAAEAGLAWLRRRNAQSGPPSPFAAQGEEPVMSEYLFSQSLEEVFVWLEEGSFRSNVFARRVIRSSVLRK